ncbi:indolepyruvate oxidoreductase subunit beta family protein [Inmirania thermothiophila]|uniref:Indolepyruvate ferredoxin oxidoreductase beta subunit n=1 Tax=Inmirania thermothiophila TaxID=1750597 RepID=A0A3N1Y134_9GAMM|nr:indolepyruvate oxidoreductase subunit beta family protein [Inmirania thermothiophila]ROR32500.1 indolepyruvate ferredoxin oxidoreductase beta subunit [Inmirania thermothiophila]
MNGSPELRPLCVVIGALGGQGGGVLADWLVEAARLAGYPAQATSIPGVAQRTGATTYYFELLPASEPEGEPVFSLYPSEGEVDVVLALEPTEAGRALERGWIGPDTVVITTSERVYSTAEKVIAGDGTVRPRPILEALQAAAGRLIHVDTRGAGRQLNAMMLGALVGAEVLPLDPEQARAAIRARGIAVESNLAGLERGLEAARAPAPPPADPEPVLDPPPPGLDGALAAFPEPLRPLLGHALARLVDYQDRAWAARYLERLRPVVEAERAAGGEAQGWPVSRETARRLAAWMSHEDVIRVAQLKTRPGRLARIRAETGAGDGDVVIVRDYLKPGRRELSALLPPGLAGLVWRPGRPSGGLALRLPTTSPAGWALLRLLAALRPLRSWSAGFRAEQAQTARWLAAVQAALAVDPALARDVAEAAVWARGYGDVRERGLAELGRLLEDFERRLAEDPAGLREAVAASLHRARHDPDAACAAGAAA